jgi:S1-C subfamily serine protease
MTRSGVLRAAVFAAFAAPLLGCGILPPLPSPLPSEWIPEVTPSPIDQDLLDSPFGFTPEERSAVRIRNLACEEYATGSGFILDEHTIVTNKHVVSDYTELEVLLSDGTDISVTSASVATIGDLALLTTVESLSPAVTLRSNPTVGEDITVVGYPEGLELTVTEGEVRGIVEDNLDNAEYIFATSAMVKPGSSGSAAFDNKGEVVGVMYAADEETGESYLIPVSILWDVIYYEKFRTELVPDCPTYE